MAKKEEKRYGFRAGSKIDAKLGSVLEGKKWIWPPARSKEMVSIQSKLAMVQIEIVDKPSGLFQKRGYTLVRKLVWFSKAIPRHSFILWLVVRNSVTTGERLMIWGYKGTV